MSNLDRERGPQQANPFLGVALFEDTGPGIPINFPPTHDQHAAVHTRASGPKPSFFKKFVEYIVSIMMAIIGCLTGVLLLISHSVSLGLKRLLFTFTGTRTSGLVPAPGEIPPSTSFGVICSPSPILLRPDQYVIPEDMRYRVTLITCSGLLIVGLDHGFFANALPTITAEFGGYEWFGWFVSAYLLLMALLQPFFRSIFEIFPRQRMYSLCVLMFGIGGTICFWSTSPSNFIAGRAVTGFGAAGILQGTHALLSIYYQPKITSSKITWVFSILGILAVIGPVIGGATTELNSWRVCFVLNPVVAFVILVYLISFGHARPPMGIAPEMTFSQRFKRLQPELYSAISLISALTVLIVYLQWIGTVNEWVSRESVFLLLGSFGSFMLFWILQFWWGENSTIPLRLACTKVVLGGIVNCFCLQIVLVSHTYLIPIYFQSIFGLSPMASGPLNAAYFCAAAFGYVLSAIFVKKLRYVRILAILATTIMTAGSWMLVSWKPTFSRGLLVLYQIVAGLGVGMALEMPFVSTRMVFRTKDVFKANMIIAYMGMVGGILAIPIAQAVISNALLTRLPELTNQVDPHYVLSLGAANYRAVPGLPNGKVWYTLDGMVYSIQYGFRIPAIMAAVAIPASFCFIGRVEVATPERDIPLQDLNSA